MDTTIINTTGSTMSQASAQYVPLSAFQTSSRFAIDPTHIGVIRSGSPGHIEVHLARFDYAEKCTVAGGTGLTIAGDVPVLRNWTRVRRLKALIAGLNEVFEIAETYDGVVVLRPLGKGLGIHWNLYRRDAAKTHRQSRHRRECASRAKRHLAAMQSRIAALAGTLDEHVTPSRPFYLLEQPDGTEQTSRTALDALTLAEAKALARRRVEELRALGWECGQEASSLGTIAHGFDGESEMTVAWLCKKGPETRRLSVKVGRPSA